MNVLNDNEQVAYSTFMDGVACSAFRESIIGVIDLKNGGADPTENSLEIGTAMGQVILDEVIEATKYMDREALVRWFAETAIAHVVTTMVNHPEYKRTIMTKLGIL